MIARIEPIIMEMERHERGEGGKVRIDKLEIEREEARMRERERGRESGERVEIEQNVGRMRENGR